MYLFDSLIAIQVFQAVLFLRLEIRCDNPVAPLHGKVIITGDAILGNSAQYACVVGFKLVGSDQRICQADGKWSGIQPSCQGTSMIHFILNGFGCLFSNNEMNE